MKIKSLQINVLALLFGLTSACSVNEVGASNATNSLEEQQIVEQNGGDFSKPKTPKQGAAGTLNWTFCGPDDASGIVTSVVSHSQSPNIVYVGAAHNGVWKNDKGGAGHKSWKKIPVENNKNLYVTCIALDEASNTIYAGTGGDFKGQGVYKAEGDGSLKLMAGSEKWKHIYKIAVSGNRVFAATSEGLMCYTNGSWKVCTGTKGATPITLDAPVADMSINKAGLVIVAMNKAECYISKAGSPDGFEYKAVSDISIYTVDNIAVTTSPVDNNVLHIVAARLTDGKVHKVLLSENQGEDWEPVLTYNQSSHFKDPLEGNGRNINRVFADPTDPYTIFIASRNIWKGKRYAPGPYDFGLSAISSSDEPESSPFYLHSNVRAMCFHAAHGEYYRQAYIATDGGLYNASILISPSSNIIFPGKPLHTNSLVIGSYHSVAANNKGWILMGSPTLGVQAIDKECNNNMNARFIWDLEPAGKVEISEGWGGPCAMSLVSEDFYIYSLYKDGALTFRRSIDNAKSFHPYRRANPNIEWFSTVTGNVMPDPKYKFAPIAMWEDFNDNGTYDTVWFKANTSTNFYEGDRTIYAPSKNFNYPIEYTVPYGFKHGDSIQVPDPVQNRFFVGIDNKVWMTRQALHYDKNSVSTPLLWHTIATLEARDTTSVFALSDDANTLYVGTRTGNVFCLTNLKKVYNTATVSLVERTLSHSFAGKIIHAMAVDPTDPNHVVVVLEGGGDNVFVSTNGTSESATYTSIKGNLPENVYSVLFPKGAKKGTIIVGTEKGIWMKEGGSGEWINNSGIMGQIPVMTLFQITTHRPGVNNVPFLDATLGKIKINYPNNNATYLTIYAGTYGSGLFSTDQFVGVDEITTKVPKESDALTVTPNPVKNTATISLDMSKGRATIQVFNTDGRCLMEQTASSDVTTINFKNYAPGTYIIQVNQAGTVRSAKVVKQ